MRQVSQERQVAGYVFEKSAVVWRQVSGTWQRAA
jgi:hypothetical protein